MPNFLIRRANSDELVILSTGIILDAKQLGSPSCCVESEARENTLISSTATEFEATLDVVS
ncbi:MAG: hypothetical protein AAGD11_00090 [Planctomycetota bacterium]